MFVLCVNVLLCKKILFILLHGNDGFRAELFISNQDQRSQPLAPELKSSRSDGVCCIRRFGANVSMIQRCPANFLTILQ